ncbi:vacuolar protein sorting-associated protein 11 homolog isoform X2 [Pogona vitticeps]
MAAYLQWRRFAFFDSETLLEPEGQAVLLPPGIAVCDSGRGSLVFGDMEGQIWFLPRSLELSSFQAYKLRVTHLYQLKQHNILASVGEDEEGINPLVKVWNLEKRDGGNPLCTRIFPAIPGNKPTVVSCLTVHENLNFMAIGFADGSIVLTKGDITRDRHSKTQILHEGSYPVTGLAFRQSGKTTHLFVATTENIQCYTLSVKDYPHLELDSRGCGLRCSTLSDPSQDLQFIVAGDECVYLYQPDERGPCFAFEGQKLIAHWYRGYLIIVSKDRKTSPKSEFAGGDPQNSDKQILNIYDLGNKFIAYSSVFDDVVDVLAEWGCLYVLTRDRKLHALQEKDTQTKLEMLFKKNLFEMAINLARSHHLDNDGLSEIFRQYGDHLYNKGNHDGAIQQYIRTIGKLEPSYVIRKFLDAQRIHNLTAYLQMLHLQSLANADHTTLLLNCYTKLKDISKLEEFIKTSESEVHFDVETAIKVLRQAGCYSHAVYLAEKHAHHEWYLKIQLEDIKSYQEALRYIGKLPFEQAESNMKRYGKILMHHVPKETTELLKVLCTDYRPAGEREGPSGLEGRKANPEEFIPIFANNSRELKAFLEHMSEVQPNSPQGVYDTLLELRLQNWAHEKDPQFPADHALPHAERAVPEGGGGLRAVRRPGGLPLGTGPGLLCPQGGRLQGVHHCGAQAHRDQEPHASAAGGANAGSQLHGHTVGHQGLPGQQAAEAEPPDRARRAEDSEVPGGDQADSQGNRGAQGQSQDLPEDQVQHLHQRLGAALCPLPLRPLFSPALL